MSSESQILPAFPLAGVRAVSLGRYLAALGVMRIAARRWPGVRGAWREGCLWVVGGPAGFDELANYVMKVEWSPYDRSWLEAQKDAEKKPPKGVPSPYALWLAKQDEDTAALALAHLVMGSTRYFNPLLGSGGNSGRRDFSKGWKEAAEAIRKPPKGLERRRCEAGVERLPRRSGWTASTNRLVELGVLVQRSVRIK